LTVDYNQQDADGNDSQDQSGTSVQDFLLPKLSANHISISKRRRNPSDIEHLEVKTGSFQQKTMRIVLSVQKVGKKLMVQRPQRPLEALKPRGDDSAAYKILAFTGLHKDRVLGDLFFDHQKIGMEAFSPLMFMWLLEGFLQR